MTDHREINQTPRHLTGVIDVDGALYRIHRTPVQLTRHPSGRTILTVDSSKIIKIGSLQ